MYIHVYTYTHTLLHLQKMPPLIGRFVPMAAVATANIINIPLMRQRYMYMMSFIHTYYRAYSSAGCDVDCLILFNFSNCRELKNGIVVVDEDGNKLGTSKVHVQL